ncbi:MAG: GNAT family N-acetyltransferase [Acidobacteria bacterium]|nr:GNAT family N-acetyltransferase [Acidobacteriota bacterium]
MLQLVERRDLSPEVWDERVRQFPGNSLFHRWAWLSYMEARHRGQRLLLEIRQGSETCGFFPAIVARKGPFRLLGSPLKGSWTMQMGPVADRLDTAAFVAALEGFCRERKVDYVELASAALDPQAIEEAGFVREDIATHLLPIASREEMWQRMNSRARNAVRQAERHGLQVRVMAERAAITEFHQQYRAALARKHLPMDWPLEMFTDLWDYLHPTGHLQVWQVFHGDTCIDTEILLCDESTLYGWAGAGWPDYFHLRPNEFVQWEILKYAAAHGIRVYDMYGEGGFKLKFGAQRVPRPRWYKTFSLSARLAREAYAAWWYGRRRVKHFLRRSWHRFAPPHKRGNPLN